MHIGYARVSTDDQNLHLQEDALKNAHCEEIFTDVASGAKSQRQGLDKAIAYLREGDTFVVWKLDRLGRSLSHLIQFINTLHEKKIHFKSLKENIDTSTSVGKLLFHFLGALAEFERDLIQERTQAGLKAARARGRLGGRPAFLSKRDSVKLKNLYDKGDLSIKQLCKLFNISKPTLYRYIKNENPLAEESDA